MIINTLGHVYVLHSTTTTHGKVSCSLTAARLQWILLCPFFSSMDPLATVGNYISLTWLRGYLNEDYVGSPSWKNIWIFTVYRAPLRSKKWIQLSPYWKRVRSFPRRVGPPCRYSSMATPFLILWPPHSCPKRGIVRATKCADASFPYPITV